MMSFVTRLRMEMLDQEPIQKKEVRSSLMNTIGIRETHKRSGASDQTPLVPTYSLMLLREFNSLTKSRTQSRLLSNGLPRKVPCVMRT